MRKRNSFLQIAAALCVATVSIPAAHAAPPIVPPKEPVFLFGADWAIDGSPAVKSLFWESGCNFVRVTGGGYGWALDKHRAALQELDAHGVQALLQLGSHYPDAKYFDMKDSYMVDQKGETGKEDRNAWAITYNGSAWPQYNYASDTFRKRLTVDFTSYLDGVKSYTNVNALLLHNEPGFHWINDRVFDYNPQSIAKFHTWLQKKHGTIDTLNKRWGTNYTSFDTADPPHDLPPVTNIAAWLDWRRYSADEIQSFLKDEIDFAHRARPGVPTTTNLSGPLDNWYAIRVGDNYRYTADFDIAGIDIYTTEWTSPIFNAYAMDMTRGAAQGKKIYVAECESFDPERFKGLTEVQCADLLRGEIWTFIGHGADAALIWSLSGQGGFHLTNGEFNPRMEAVREIAHLSPMLHVGAFQKPAARVAVCVDQDSYLYYGGVQKAMDGAGHVDQDARAMYQAVRAGNYDADVISVSQLRDGTAKKYGVLVLAMPVLMDGELAAKLRTFVSEGGTLIAEAPFAQRDHWGQEVSGAPGFGLSEVLGIQNIKGDGSANDKITTASGSFNAVNRTSFTTTTARVVGTFADKKPAITVNQFGKGTAVYIGAEVGLANQSAVSDLRTFLAATIAQNAKMPPSVRLTKSDPGWYLDTSVRRDARGNRLIVLTNSADKGKALPTMTQVGISMDAKSVAPATQAFLIGPTQHSGGRVVAGPQPITMKRVGTDTSIALPDVTSMAAILLATDATPLLSVAVPEKAAAGSTVSVEVTCYNPSAKPLTVKPKLMLPASWKVVGVTPAVTISARGKQIVILKALSGGGDRSVLTARIDYTNAQGSAHTDSVPVDVYATAAP